MNILEEINAKMSKKITNIEVNSLKIYISLLKI